MEIDARGPDGNAFAIMAHVRRLLYATDQRKKWPEVQKRMESGTYDNLCKVAEEATYGSITIVNRVNT